MHSSTLIRTPTSQATCAARRTPLSYRCSQQRLHQMVLRPVRVANVDTAQFEEQVLKSDKPVLVDFWANWCGPCRLVAPLMDALEKEHGGVLKVVKVEHDSNPKLIEKYKVYGLPTLILFKDGQEISGSKREGAVTKPMLLAYLKQHQIIA